MTGPEQSPFAAGLHMTADRLERDAAWLRAQADGEQQEWDQFGDPADTILRLERERDEARAELERWRNEALEAPRAPHGAGGSRGEGTVERAGGLDVPPAAPGCHCTATEVCFPCRDREAHPGPEPVTAADPALLVPGSEWMDPEDGEVVRVESIGSTVSRLRVAEVLVQAENMEPVGTKVRRYLSSAWQRVSPPPAEAPDVEPGQTASEGARRIAAERQRQMADKAWTPEHDDTHGQGELAVAAAAYALHGIASNLSAMHVSAMQLWPWEPEGWKPKDRLRNLERAGALIAAEIDRLSRSPLAWAASERDRHEAEREATASRWAEFKRQDGEAPDVEPATSQVSSSREVEPATDEQIAEWEQAEFYESPACVISALIDRVRQTEERFETAVRWAERLLRTVDEKKDERDEARAEAARLREQVAAMQAADAGAFW